MHERYKSPDTVIVSGGIITGRVKLCRQKIPSQLLEAPTKLQVFNREPRTHDFDIDVPTLGSGSPKPNASLNALYHAINRYLVASILFVVRSIASRN
jgi:hypothetical protein